MNPARKVAEYPIVTTTTCVASQKFESRTACIISIVSPEADRLCATMSVAKPMRLVAIVRTPMRENHSPTRASGTQAQPMKTAEL